MLFTYNGTLKKEFNRPINKRPVDSGELLQSNIPIAKYYRKTLECNCNNEIIETFNNVDCCKSDREKRVYSANTNLDKSYYTTSTQYLRSRCKTFNQNYVNLDKTSGDANGDGITRPNCYNCQNCDKITYYKRNNDTFGTQGAVSSSARLLRLKYNNIKTTGKYNVNRPRYHGDATQNVYLTQTNPICFHRNGNKNHCPL